ncbi:MAG: LPS-assembly protein LptD [Beijerinckiaceae bacterium]
MKGRICSSRPSRNSHLLGAVAAIAMLTALGQASPLHAQTLNDRLGQNASSQKGRLLVEAKEVVYDNDKERVEARGDVQLYYQGRTLEADRVTYDRKTKRVYAEGNARIIETNGQIVYSDRFELTDDFKDGFIDSLRVVMPDKQRISAARGERIDGETTVFERGIYTACDSCKDNPEKPPLWQVKAARIIAKNSEQMIYYEDARIEFFGLPLAYIPFFSAPDPTVTRKSGILTPRYSRRSNLGFGFSLPIYYAPAPHFDLLWTPTAYSQQGLHNEIEWRHRLETGIYNIRASGIFQMDSGAFLSGPLGPNKTTIPAPTGPNDPVWKSGIPNLSLLKTEKRVFRGNVETTGKFLINKNWHFGWDVNLTTDKFYLGNYRIRSESAQVNYFKESVSSVYLRGKTDRAFFDATSMYFQGLTYYDWQKQIPVVHPVIDYNRRFTPDTIGGELALDVNFTSLSRERPDFGALPPANLRFASQENGPKGVGSRWFGAGSLFNYSLGNTGYGLYQNCAVYTRGNCLLRGIAGTTNRASASLSWRRNFIDPIGQVWTPFVSAQVDVTHYSLNQNNGANTPINNTFFGNSQQTNFIKDSDTQVRAMPTIGLEYRYPFVASYAGATHLFEPIGQIIVRPNEQKIGRLPNEDAQSLVFSDSNLFSINKFSGYDRTEGGVRANVGAQYTATFSNGSYANVLIGQSYHLAGRNSFKAGTTLADTDLTNVGANSGLDKARSDYVTRFTFAPSRQISFAARGRFDDESLKLKRLELSSTFVTGPLTTNILYARQDAQPDLGFVRRREGVAWSASYALPNNWYVSGNINYDLDRYIYDRDLYVTQANPANSVKYKDTPFRPNSFGLGISYIDECTTFSFNYQRSTTDNFGARSTAASTFLLRLELRHLGQLNYRQSINSTPAADGTR